jgi:hypothetical protein
MCYISTKNYKVQVGKKEELDGKYDDDNNSTRK